MKSSNIAIIGSGIAGLSAAWLLSKTHRVTVFEAADYAGGHANTTDVETQSGPIAVDTGFIVYNPPNYPNLCALFDHLGVATNSSAMSFAFSGDNGRYEYSGTRLGGLFGQPSNITNPAHWRMLMDLVRFFRDAEQRATMLSDEVTLSAFLSAGGYSPAFIDNHLLPMAAAIWSGRAADMAHYPAKAFIRFFANHGLLQTTRRPQWRTVDGGSRMYVKRIIDDGKFEILLSSPVRSVRRHRHGVELEDDQGCSRPFDHVVLSTHADQSLQMLANPSPDERMLLGAFNYTINAAVVHTDTTHMPKRRRLWSSWNYLLDGIQPHRPSVTYWMNSLQGLACKEDIFVSLNPQKTVANEITRFRYSHPLFDSAALAAQKHLWSLQGARNTWFCGSYFGAGFHEDAIQSGLAVAEQLGEVRRPWQVMNESGRIHVRTAATAPRIAAE